MKQSVQKIFEGLFANIPELVQCRSQIEAAYEALKTCYSRKGKVLVCGNGGSAADAEHIVGELMKAFAIKRPISQTDADKIKAVDTCKGELIAKQLQRGLPAISLVSQTSLITAFANDVDAELVFAQQVYGYGTENDVLIAISTSGNSKNVCAAAIVGKAMGLSVVGLTGSKKCTLENYCNVLISVPSDITYKIQEYHQPVYHALCLMIEEEFFGV